jgi:hypothetical protein
MKLMMGAISFQQLSNWHDACISDSEIAGDGSPKPEYVAYHHLSHRRFLAMTTFLHIDFSPLFGRSVSRQLTSPFVTRWKSSTRMEWPLTAIRSSHFAALFFTVQLIGGLLLLSGYFVPLALTLLAAELYNILAFHLTLAPASIPLALLTCVMWVLVFLRYRDSFKGVLAAEPSAKE